MNMLDTGIKLVKNVNRYNFGRGSIGELRGLLEKRRSEARACNASTRVAFFVDEFFANKAELLAPLAATPDDVMTFVSTADEPTTDLADGYTETLRQAGLDLPCAIVGMGGGITMDSAKAVANLLTNGGQATQYQGWDLVKKPGVFKIGIPTISGTGSEATRTCVMTNPKTGLKLGMNSDYTVFDHVIMDPDLTATVERNQYFYTGMDAYIHCIEALAGSYRNAIGDAYSRETVRLCREVFHSEDMMTFENRERLMVASFLGGAAIATSYVGVVHPFSAGLSVVLGLHHCVANCIAMRGLSEFYPAECDEYWTMVAKQGVKVPEGVARDLTDAQYKALYDSTIVHEKPLTNALGIGFKNILTPEKVTEIFKLM